MDTDPKLWHSVGHETPWNRCTARKPQTTGSRSLATGENISLCSVGRCFIPELCASLVPGLSQEWPESSSAKTNPGTTSALAQSADTPSERDPLARTRRNWILH